MDEDPNPTSNASGTVQRLTHPGRDARGRPRRYLPPRSSYSIVIHLLWQLFLLFRHFWFRSLLEGPLRSGTELRGHQYPKPRVWVIDELRVCPGLSDTAICGVVSGKVVTLEYRYEPSKTTIRSARAIVDSRWATSRHVVCFLRRILSIASLTWDNVSEVVGERDKKRPTLCSEVASSALVASSKTKIAGFFSSALAIASLCR